VFDRTPVVDSRHPVYPALVFAADGLLDRLDLRPGMKLLQVEAGSGLLALGALQRVGPSGRVVVVDTRAEVLADLYDQVRAAGLDDRLDAHEMRADRLDFRAGYFDALAADGVLAALEDPLTALKRWRRVVRPGGLMAAGVWSGAGAGERALARALGLPPVPSSPDHWREQALAAGWTGVEVEARTVPCPLEDAGRAAAVLEAGRLGPALAALPAAERSALLERCLAPGGGPRLELGLYVIRARRPAEGHDR